MHSQVDFDSWQKHMEKKSRVYRLIEKTRATRNMSLSDKKRVALSIMSSPLQRMSNGAKQYAMAVAIQEAQKKVKVQPVGFFTMGDEEDGGGPENNFTVRRKISWGTVDTRLVSYDIPIEIPDDKNENKENHKKITTERMMKIEQIVNISRNFNENLREYYIEKQASGAISTA